MKARQVLAQEASGTDVRVRRLDQVEAPAYEPRRRKISGRPTTSTTTPMIEPQPA
jgi:hypothetical protein